MNESVKHFIEENIELIEKNRWEEVYNKAVPKGFTETLLTCDINPLEYGLNYIPHDFLRNSKIEKFIIPNNVTSIGHSAFDGCTQLTSIEIPDSVTSIGEGTFYYCSSLTSITIPNGVTSIGYDTFSGCSSLTSVVIGSGVTSIDNYAFADCTSLNTIKYLGTKKEAISLGVGNKTRKKWRQDSSIKKIICADGEILL